MALKMIEMVCEIFGYIAEIDGDKMKVHFFIDTLYSHSVELL